MASHDGHLKGEALLVAVTDALVGLHERHYGRKPKAARSELMDGELLACVMGGIYTEVEKTLIELQRSHLVDEVRSSFQQAMRTRLIDVVEGLSGRSVDAFLSTHNVGPDLEIEIFVLGPAPG